MSFEVRLWQLQLWADEQEKAFTLHPKKEIELIIMSTPFVSDKVPFSHKTSNYSVMPAVPLQKPNHGIVKQNDKPWLLGELNTKLEIATPVIIFQDTK